MGGVERLEVEYRDADDTLLQLLAFEVRRSAGLSHFDLSGQEVGLAAAVAIMQAWHRVIRWQGCDGSPGALVAREVVAEAVAAEALHSQFPAVAARLREPWCTAVRVRASLRTLGRDVEEAALRLLPSWRLPVDELPETCVALMAAPPDCAP